MESSQPQEPKKDLNHGLSVHVVLAQGYILYFAAIVLGFAASYIWPESISFPLEGAVGIILILLGTAIIFWAQHAANSTSHHRNVAAEKICRDHFCVGPYVYTRSPTQYGLFVMAFGLSLVYGSFYMAVLTVLAFLIGKLVIIPREERHLEARYGEAYAQYKDHVKF